MPMAVTQIESMTSLNSDIFYNILGRLDGATLASAACTCAAFCSISKEENMWKNVCCSLWPSTNSEDVRNLISSIGGFRKFYADCFPLIVNKEVPVSQWDNYVEYAEEWLGDDYYDELDGSDSISPSDFVSIVDVRYQGKTIYSKVKWGILDSDEFSGWFYNCPFHMDLLSYSDGNDDGNDKVILSVADGMSPITSIDQERKDGKLWKELRDGIRLSWIVVNKKLKQAANVASWTSLGGQRHWPTDRDFLIRFGSILPATDILPSKVVECIIVMKFKVIEVGDREGSQTSLQLTELSMQLEDVGGAHVNGRNSLLVLREALSCHRSKNYSEALESCRLYSNLQKKVKEEKMQTESCLDKLCILSGFAAFFTFWYCIL